MQTSLQPTSRKDRVALLDILRGFAILGIFIANLYGLSYYWSFTDAEKAQLPLAAYDEGMDFLHTIFIEGKFYSLFSLLFGIGFAMYLNKSDESGTVLKTFKRRLAVLLLIGFLHLMLWSGDIVAFYALLGFILIPFRKLGNKTLLVLAGLCILSPIGWYALTMSNPEVFNLAQWPRKVGIYLEGAIGIESEEQFMKAAKGDDPVMFLQMNFGGIFFRYADLIFQSRAFKVFGMFLVGLVIGRTYFYNKLQENKKLLWYILATGLIVGLVANYYFATFKEIGGYYRFTSNGLKQTIAYAFGVVPLALAYAAAFALLYLNPAARRIMNITAPVGRMALTNYISHTLIGLLVFSGLGFGWREMGPTSWTLFAIGVYIFQVIFSTIWLRYFYYGPMEWLWRSATYKRWQPMRKRMVSEPVPAVEMAK